MSWQNITSTFLFYWFYLFIYLYYSADWQKTLCHYWQTSANLIWFSQIMKVLFVCIKWTDRQPAETENRKGDLRAKNRSMTFKDGLISLCLFCSADAEVAVSNYACMHCRRYWRFTWWLLVQINGAKVCMIFTGFPQSQSQEVSGHVIIVINR